MRIWQDATGALITDEALVRYIAAYGSLEAAAAAGNVRLVECGRESGCDEMNHTQCDQDPACSDARVFPRTLKDYLLP
ncbi:hypothetical protein [Adlercreutzia sp. ZJ141]|uniref:hypothetical protein n=1 Tax=Adlercreutzia sp. ZJ141 TaxID=2709406 RepID=UPI0013EC019B|nr:hypothetical protein [Adlercreutzia sp. ZJ141]